MTMTATREKQDSNSQKLERHTYIGNDVANIREGATSLVAACMREKVVYEALAH